MNLINNKEKIFGLLGYPLGHSFSKSYFTDFFEREGYCDCKYVNFEVQDISNFRDFIASQPDIQGFNVTIPHKKRIISHLDEVDSVAKEVGAVNCVTVERKKDGGIFLKGYNTDVYGFKTSLLELIGDERPKALVFGNGGAAAAVCYVLRTLEIEYVVVSRQITEGVISYDDVTDDMLRGALLINTTPLGMYPNIDNCVDINYEVLDENSYLYDLVYNPMPTIFLERGVKKGAKTMGGIKMLILQAQKAWEYFSEI